MNGSRRVRKVVLAVLPHVSLETLMYLRYLRKLLHRKATHYHTPMQSQTRARVQTWCYSSTVHVP